MKQNNLKRFNVVLVIALLLEIFSCKHNNDTAQKKPKIIHAEYKMIAVTPPASGIIGKDPSAQPVMNDNRHYYKGVFTKGRKVKLSPYEIGQTEVTYELWYEVRTWAEKNGYKFMHKGVAGSEKGKPISGMWYENVGAPPVDKTKKHPVTMVVFPDLIVWCNAYTEILMGKEHCVYRAKDDHSKILKESTIDNSDLIWTCFADITKKGYRLPTEAEWEFAARYKGDGSDEKHKINASEYGTGVWLSNLNSVVGAEKPIGFKGMDISLVKGESWVSLKEHCELFCVYNMYYDGVSDKFLRNNLKAKTNDAASKKPNALGIYDMSGNIWEYCFDHIKTGDTIIGDVPDKDGFVVNPQGGAPEESSFVLTRGGCYSSLNYYCLPGYRSATDFITEGNWFNGFRLVKSK